MTPPTAAEREAWREQHQNRGRHGVLLTWVEISPVDLCHCNEPWPCPTVRTLDALDAAETSVDQRLDEVRVATGVHLFQQIAAKKKAEAEAVSQRERAEKTAVEYARCFGAYEKAIARAERAEAVLADWRKAPEFDSVEDYEDWAERFGAKVNAALAGDAGGEGEK